STSCSTNGTMGRSSEPHLKPAEIRLAILSPSFAIRRTRERRVAGGADSSGIQAGLAQPCAAGMSLDPERMVGLTFGRGRLDRLGLGLWSLRFSRSRLFARLG